MQEGATCSRSSPKARCRRWSWSRWLSRRGCCWDCWRDVAEVVAGRITWVQSQPFAMGARAVGSRGLDFFGRHVWPYLRPALMVELSFQAAAVLVLLAELGFLQYYLGGFTILNEGDVGFVPGFTLANTPELGQLLSAVRLYALRNEYFPVLVPAFAIALAALAFEIIGRAFRGRTDRPTCGEWPPRCLPSGLCATA